MGPWSYRATTGKNITLATGVKAKLPPSCPICHSLLFNQLPIPALLLDANGRILEASELTRQLLGGPGVDAADSSCLLKRLSHHDRVRLMLVLGQTGGQPTGRLDNLLLSDTGLGVRSFDLIWRLLEDQTGKRCMLLQLFDVTAERVTAQDQLQTEARRASDEILRLATTDSLTGLPNRNLFLDRLNQVVSLARRERETFALLFADLDHFKEVNDTLGHAVGDELLIEIAHRLRDAVREMDTVARLGGDEFVVLLPNISRDHALELADRLLHQLHEPMALDGTPDYRAQASVGLVMFPDDGDSGEALLRHADQAMYAAKRAGRNQLQAYTAELGDALLETYSLHQELRAALEQGQLEVHWQPKFRLQDMAVVGAEALVRWQHPRLGLLDSNDFLPVAVQHQLLGAVDTWMLQTTLRQVAAWAGQGRWPDHWRLALNQSASDLQRPDWLDQLSKLLAALGLKPSWLEIELTEVIWARPAPDLIERLEQFRDLGVALLIDDFGTGYSSLSYLSKLPVSGVKIDQCFVRGMQQHEGDRVLVEIICELVHRLKLDLMAEGIETEPQRQRLLQLGCPLGQGFLLSGPLPLAEFERRFLPPVSAS